MKKLIYIAHPFNGREENAENVGSIVTEFAKAIPDYVFFSPIHATGFLYHELDYLKGMEYCLEMLRRCDELWLCDGWENSRGCCMEYGFAKAKGIPYKEISDCDVAMAKKLKKIKS